MLTIKVIEVIGSPLLFYVFTLYDFCVSWKSRLQYSVALFANKFEYIDDSKAMKEVLWFRDLINELGALSNNEIAYSNS